MNKKSFIQTLKGFAWRLSLIGSTALLFLVIYLDSQVKDAFNQRAWNIPAKVFARPLEFSEGKKLSASELEQELKLLGYRRKIKAINQGEFEYYQDADGAKSWVIATRQFNFWDGEQDAQILDVTIKNGEITKLKDFASQHKVNFLRLDPLTLGTIQAGDIEDRQLINLDELPDFFIATLLTIEDRDFYQHSGVSLKGIARAAWSNLIRGKMRQGGSTLTQQLIKNHFLTAERNLWRKFKEAIMAILIEFHYDKNVILQAYINEVYLGQNGPISIHGFARASEFYFDTPFEKLNLSQVALLVGMVKGPSLYNPHNHPKNAIARRNLVLNQMVQQGLITQSLLDDAIANSLQVVAKAKARSSNVPAFMGYIKRELHREYSLSALNNHGLRLFTTLDPLVQANAETTLASRLTSLEAGRQQADQEIQGALIVSDIVSGDILAMVGDRNPDYQGFNRAIDAYRQTGSVIKPFVYLTALKTPSRFNLITELADEPFSLTGTDGSVWTPQNHDKKSHGKIELKEGLINSYNLATAKLALDVGVENIVEVIKDAGFERPFAAYPSMALGAKEMSPLEVLKLYQLIASNGQSVEASGLIAVQDHQGHLLQRYQRTITHSIDPQGTFMVKYLLTEVVKRGTARAIGERFNNKRYAGKTGTTDDLRDSWYAGFGGKRLAVVWLGRDDNKPSSLTGASGALLVWKDLFLNLNEPSVSLNLVEDLVWAAAGKDSFFDFSDCQQRPSLPFYVDLIPPGYEVCE